jgi:predicted dehydrogenase
LAVDGCTVAIVGAGAMALEHTRAFKDAPGVSLVGITSRTRERAQSLAEDVGIERVFDCIDEMQKHARPDLVVVAVSAQSMYQVGLEALSFDWTVLLEKPPGLSPADTSRLLSAAEDYDTKVYLGLNRRFMSSTRAVLSRLSTDSGQRHIVVEDQQDMNQIRALDHPEIVVNSLMYANSVHLIDYLTLFGRGDVVNVEQVTPWNPDEPDVMVAYVEFSSGDTGTYTCMWNRPGPWSATVTTADVRLEMRPLEEATVQEAGSRITIQFESSDWDQSFKPGFRLQAEEAVRAAMGEPSNLPTLLEASKTVRLIESIYSSADAP